MFTVLMKVAVTIQQPKNLWYFSNVPCQAFYKIVFELETRENTTKEYVKSSMDFVSSTSGQLSNRIAITMQYHYFQSSSVTLPLLLT